MSFSIAVLKGDGIGPEIIDAALNVLTAIEERSDLSFTFTEGTIGASAIHKTGSPYPDTTRELCASSDAVLLGAIGDPSFDQNPDSDVRPEQGLLALRKHLRVFANLRPVKLFPGLESAVPLKKEIVSGLDVLFVRELTGGIYFGTPSEISEDGSHAVDTCTYTRSEIERIAHIGFKQAMKRSGKLTLVDKANVLATSRLWRSVVQDLSSSYPDVDVSMMYVDNAAMQLILNPTQFDVILTENMFGDILSDEASILGGSLGLLPSASVGADVGLYEPAHGSYPQAAGKNIANPMATLLSVAMLLEDVCDAPSRADGIRQAIEQCITNRETTPDLFSGSETTTSVTKKIIDYLPS